MKTFDNNWYFVWVAQANQNTAEVAVLLKIRQHDIGESDTQIWLNQLSKTTFTSFYYTAQTSAALD